MNDPKRHKKGYSGIVVACWAVLIFAMASFGELKGQDLDPGWRHWNINNFTYKPKKDLYIRVGAMFSIDPAPMRLSFAQGDLRIQKRIQKRNYVAIGYNNIVFPRGVENRNMFHRVYLQGQRKATYFGVRVKHRMDFQLYLPEVEKYAYRINYQFRIYYYNKWMPFKGRPYVAQEILWYGGGKPVVYFDEFGRVEDFRAPFGPHRYRLNVGVYTKPHKRVSLTFFWRRQWEFNTRLFKNREINIVRDGGAITYPFNNYWVWGWVVSYTLPGY